MTIVSATVDPTSQVLCLLLKTLRSGTQHRHYDLDHRHGDEADLVRGVDTHDWSGHEAHCASHLVAVLVQLIECLISRLHQVHAHAINLQGGKYQIKSCPPCSIFLWHVLLDGILEHM